MVCERVGPGSSSSIGYPDEEAMGGEYMRVLDTSPSLMEACSTYQRQAPRTMRDNQRLPLLPGPLTPVSFFT